MGHEDDGGTVQLADQQQLLDGLLLHGDVEGAGGLVGQQHGGGEQHGGGDGHALHHAAGKLEGVASEDARRVRKAEPLQERGGPFAELRLRYGFMGRNRLVELRPHGADRTEGGARVLEDHGQLRPAKPTVLRFRKLGKIPSFIYDAPLRDAAPRREQPHRRPEQRALPAAGLADDAEDLPAAQTEAHVTHRGHALICDCDVLIVQKLFHRRALLFHSLVLGSM